MAENEQLWAKVRELQSELETASCRADDIAHLAVQALEGLIERDAPVSTEDLEEVHNDLFAAMAAL